MVKPTNNPAAADVLVVGGGAAGIFAAVAAATTGAQVTLLEKNDRLGRKMIITGGGRGNLTNSAPLHDFIKNVPGNGSFLFSALNCFSSIDCRDFFKKLGIPTKEEEHGRVFPAQAQADQVVDTLTQYLATTGVRIIYLARTTGLILDNRRCQGVIAGRRASGQAKEQQVFPARAVIIATGGASYPHTGSTGDGYRLAESASHQVTPRHAGLAPLCLAEQHLCKQLQGISLTNILLTLFSATGQKTGVAQGEAIFTHFGLSGPAALRLSREMSSPAVSCGAGRQRLFLDLFPEISEEDLTGLLLTKANAQPQKAAGQIFKQLLPASRLAAVCVQLPQFSLNQKAGETGKEAWRTVARHMKNLPFSVTGTKPLSEAMITVGGVSVKEIDPRTMASRLVEGLYFAGEVLDVDAYTGGFNLQIAFSTGWAAGLAAAAAATDCRIV